jgi:DNA polymerase-3 subunit beta
MKFNVKRETFLKAVQKVANIIGTRSTIPVVANILLEAAEGKLMLTTTDLEIRISATIEAAIEVEGKTTLPAKKLQAMVSKFYGEEISFNVAENDHAEIKCGTSNFKLLGLPARDFPLSSEFPTVRTVVFAEKDLSKMFDYISYAVSLDDSRKALHGILFSVVENTVTSVATDGKRLALVEKIPESFKGEEGDTIIPLKTANEAKRLFDGEGKVSVMIGEKQAVLQSDSLILTTKLLEGNYPNYRQVIPASFSNSVEVESSLFLSKLELVSLALSDNSAYIILDFEDKLIKFQASSTSIGEGSDYIETDYSGEPLSISFNPVFLADPLRHIDSDKFTIKVNQGYSPVALEGGDGFLYVIMPMRNR